jgi:hypothetical protein
MLHSLPDHSALFAAHLSRLKCHVFAVSGSSVNSELLSCRSHLQMYGIASSDVPGDAVDTFASKTSFSKLGTSSCLWFEPKFANIVYLDFCLRINVLNCHELSCLVVVMLLPFEACPSQAFLSTRLIILTPPGTAPSGRFASTLRS